MKRKLLFFVSLTLVIVLSYFTVRALTYNHETLDIINIHKNGGTGATTHEKEVRETNVTVENLGYTSSGYLGKVTLDVEPGYYVSSFEATHMSVDGPLMLGFEAGAESGGFFRDNPYRADKTEYQFLIPEGASDEDPVEVNYNLTQKKPLDITYFKYTSNDTSENAYSDISNYDLDNELSLIDAYRDGDIILPEDCMEKGCAVKFKFTNEDEYNEYKNHKITEEHTPWVWADGFIFTDHGDERTLIANDQMCIENDNSDGYYCYLVVTKGFEEVGNAPFTIGYTKMNIFAPNTAGIKVSLDIENFFDTLNDKDQITFSNNKKEATIEAFYGTRTITLEKLSPKALVKDGNQHMGSLKAFDDITGSGYGYNVYYNNMTGKGFINIDSYYQDKIAIEFNITNNNEDIFGGKVKINLDRFAFNNWVTEVDAQGRNCEEGNNGNNCASGRYYSVQYRGIPKFMYITEEEQEKQQTTGPATVIDRYYEDDPSHDGELILREVGPTVDPVYERNVDFNPHAIALFYDENDEIVLTKDFDLNSEVYFEGFVTKDKFNELYEGAQVTDEDGNPVTVDQDYVRLGINNVTLIKDITYFFRNIEGTIMHEIVLISKEEASDMHIKKIALFLINGELDNGNIPELTYGLGEGKIFELRGEN